ncbi:hypothetical protein GYMLUDRAFT_175844, partial [Collybiopsis luxurians FD-317 M1]
KDTKDHPPEIPLRERTSSREQLGRSLLLTSLVFFPSVAPITTSLILLLREVRLPFLVGRETRKNEYGFYAESL